MTSDSIPLHLLTGFLGTGKTTLLNRLLKREEYADTLVIVNEFGSIPIDHHLIEKSSETILELSNGCLCCSIRGELTEKLLSVETSAFSRIIIESTGIADPLPVFQSLCLDEIACRGMRPGIVLSVFDSLRGSALLCQHEEARKQLALSEAVFISHTDKYPDTDAVNAIIASGSRAAIITDNPLLLDLDALAKQVSNPLEMVCVKAKDDFSSQSGSHAHPHAHNNDKYNSLVFYCHEPHPISVFTSFLHQLAVELGNDFLRAKGFAFCPGECRPVLLQMSGPVLHDPVFMESWPNGKAETTLVIIGKNIAEAPVRKLFNSYFSISDIDTPDRTAMMENPLSISGISANQLPFSTRKT